MRLEHSFNLLELFVNFLLAMRSHVFFPLSSSGLSKFDFVDGVDGPREEKETRDVHLKDFSELARVPEVE